MISDCGLRRFRNSQSAICNLQCGKTCLAARRRVGIRSTSTYPTARSECRHGTSAPVRCDSASSVQSEHLPLAQVRERAMPVPVPPADAGEAGANQQQPGRPIAFGRDQRLGRDLLGRDRALRLGRSRCTNRSCRTIRRRSPPRPDPAPRRQVLQAAASRAGARADCSRDTAARRARESPACAASSRAALASEFPAASRGPSANTVAVRGVRDSAASSPKISPGAKLRRARVLQQPRHVLQKNPRRRPLPRACRLRIWPQFATRRWPSHLRQLRSSAKAGRSPAANSAAAARRGPAASDRAAPAPRAPCPTASETRCCRSRPRARSRRPARNGTIRVSPSRMPRSGSDGGNALASMLRNGSIAQQPIDVALGHPSPNGTSQRCGRGMAISSSGMAYANR